MSKLPLIEMSLKSAAGCEQKGNRNLAAWNYSTAIFAILSHAVSALPSFAAAKPFLDEQRTTEWLDRFNTLTALVFKEIEEGNAPASAIGGNYHLLAFAHVASLLDEPTLMDSMVTLANKAEVAKLSTPFWNAYAQSFACLRQHTMFNIPELKLRGQERYLIRDLALMQAVATGSNTSVPLGALDKALSERNADAKIKDDNYDVEGSARHPVQWDFRRESILRIGTWK